MVESTACLLESGLGLPDRLLGIRLVILCSTLPNRAVARAFSEKFGQRGVSIANNEKPRKGDYLLDAMKRRVDDTPSHARSSRASITKQVNF